MKIDEESSSCELQCPHDVTARQSFLRHCIHLVAGEDFQLHILRVFFVTLLVCSCKITKRKRRKTMFEKNPKFKKKTELEKIQVSQVGDIYSKFEELE